ncbi:MAG: SMP-30/gluconolactonase/LRE family protein [Acidobacteriaceae bacterium]|nr:SMP-30/gluconolactonase/LRE family protein [Acidobacteriaceae bacterium]
MRRRALLGLLLSTIALAAAFPAWKHLGVRAAIGDQTATKPEAVRPEVDRLDPALDALLLPAPKLIELSSGFKWTEGPVWLPTGHLLFAEIPSNSIREWTPSDGVSIFMQPSGYRGSTPYCGPEPGSNGMTLDSKGRLTVAGHAQRDVWRLETLNPHGQVTVLADTYQGKRLNSPNDLVYRSDGSLYFTDPPYGLCTQNEKDPAKELPFAGVYRTAGALSQKPGSPPDRAALQLLVRDLPRPNGIAFSPDEKYLYVNNTEPEMLWMRYTVNADGSLKDPKLFFDAGPIGHNGAPDGMKVDVQGDIYSAGPGGVFIFSPEGKHLGTIRFPKPVGNLTFGGPDGKTLYITASDKVYSLEVKVSGIYPHIH